MFHNSPNILTYLTHPVNFLHFVLGTGTIELTEFINIIESRKESIQLEDAMREAFDVFDQDQNGYIDRKELKSVMHRLGSDLTDDVIDKMIKDADKDGDGRIDFEGKFLHVAYRMRKKKCGQTWFDFVTRVRKRNSCFPK